MENKELDQQHSTPEHAENTDVNASTPLEETTSQVEESVSEVEVPETVTETEVQSEVAETSEEESKQLEDEQDSQELASQSLPGLSELVGKAKEIAESHDWQNGGHTLKELKAKWFELKSDIPEGLGALYTTLEVAFNEAEQSFFNRRKVHYEEMDKKRKDNLEIKKGLLEKIEKLIERKKWTAQGELRSIQDRWEKIKHIPHEAAEELNASFTSLVDSFEKQRVEFFVKRREQEELNLEGKLYVLDRLKSLVGSIKEETESDWAQLDHQFEEDQNAWKKIGRIPAEKSDEIWKEFKDLKDAFHAKKLSLNTVYKKEIEGNERKKRNLIERAQKLIDVEDLAEAAREINRLHKEWKDIGPVTPDKSEELWNEFKNASDTFNNYKNEHTDEIKDQEKTNYDLKVKLCDEAEILAEEDDWKKAGIRFQEMLEEWRTVGPVPRRKTKKIWQRFKKAMDNFYARKRQHQKDQRNVEKENLQRKKDIVELIIALENAEDMQAAITKVKELQQEYQRIGYVPIKFKDKINKSYKEACDIFYKQLRSQQRSDSSYSHSGHSGFDSDAKRENQSKFIQLQKLKRQAEKVNETILNYSDTKTFIKPNKKGLALRDEIDLKIATFQEEYDQLNKEIETLKQEMDSGKTPS
jgi:hypothetical protein